MVLAAVVIIGILAEAATAVSSRMVQLDREAELLFRGQAYQRAIRSYYEAGNPIKQYPRNLEDLLKDPRFPNMYHIRALYRDPMAKDDKGEWLLVRAADGGIAGVASASMEEPLKKANFPRGLERLAGAKTYAEWTFEYVALLPVPRLIQNNNPVTSGVKQDDGAKVR
jgi:type II secretory pathway pseudopilin PulG